MGMYCFVWVVLHQTWFLVLCVRFVYIRFQVQAVIQAIIVKLIRTLHLSTPTDKILVKWSQHSRHSTGLHVCSWMIQCFWKKSTGNYTMSRLHFTQHGVILYVHLNTRWWIPRLVFHVGVQLPLRQTCLRKGSQTGKHLIWIPSQRRHAAWSVRLSSLFKRLRRQKARFSLHWENCHLI